MVLRGSCQCGGVRFEITGPLMGMANCHCTQCRKAHSATFRTRARVRRADFRWLQGEDLVKFHEYPRTTTTASAAGAARRW